MYIVFVTFFKLHFVILIGNVPFLSPGLFSAVLTRIRTEMTFGLLKALFACQHGLRVAPDWACRIMSVCVVFYDIATIQEEMAVS